MNRIYKRNSRILQPDSNMRKGVERTGIREEIPLLRAHQVPCGLTLVASLITPTLMRCLPRNRPEDTERRARLAPRKAGAACGCTGMGPPSRVRGRKRERFSRLCSPRQMSGLGI